MELFGIIAFVLIIFQFDEISKLKKRINNIAKKEKKEGGNIMSELMMSLVGKKCIIESSDAYKISKKTELECEIINVDDEWMQFKYIDKNGEESIHLIRIENVDNIKIV